jgi:hypothetical protein
VADPHPSASTLLSAPAARGGGAAAPNPSPEKRNGRCAHEQAVDEREAAEAGHSDHTWGRRGGGATEQSEGSAAAGRSVRPQAFAAVSTRPAARPRTAPWAVNPAPPTRAAPHQIAAAAPAAPRRRPRHRRPPLAATAPRSPASLGRPTAACPRGCPLARPRPLVRAPGRTRALQRQRRQPERASGVRRCARPRLPQPTARIRRKTPRPQRHARLLLRDPLAPFAVAASKVSGRGPWPSPGADVQF